MKRKIGGFLLFLAQVVLFISVPVMLFIGLRYYYPDSLYYFWGNIMVMLLYSAILYFMSRIYNGYNFGNSSLQEIILSWILSLIIVNCIQYFVISLRAEALLPILGLVYISVAQIVIIIPVASIVNMLYYRLNPAQKATIVYSSTEKLHAYGAIISKQWKKFRVDHVISQDEADNLLLDAVNKSGAVFFLDVDEKKLDRLIEYCYLHNIQTYIFPTFPKILLNTARTVWLSDIPVFSVKSPHPDMGTLLIKRCMDIAISLILIVLLSWLMLGVWFAVYFYDKHPAIYRQVRVTRGRRRFTLYKFRSMRPDAEDDGVPRLTAKGDDRITPIGRFIRITRIDELPQLFNVLSGSMSIVGPRPERPEIAKQYEEIYPNFAFRTNVKAGITGFAQIYGRYNTAPEDKLFLDIMYIETHSIPEDIKLMLQTIKVIFKPSSTEGIGSDSTTALK